MTPQKPKPAKRFQQPGEPSPRPTSGHISGSDLSPDLSDVAVMAQDYWYWVGVTKECPKAFLTAGGCNFPKAEEALEDDPTRLGQKIRRPVIGTIHKFNETQLRLIMKHLPCRVVRILPQKNAIGAQQAVEIVIPSDDEVKQSRALGRPDGKYIPEKGDEPVSRYIFMVPCPDQSDPTRGHEYPPPLEESGFQWPDGLE